MINTDYEEKFGKEGLTLTMCCLFPMSLTFCRLIYL